MEKGIVCRGHGAAEARLLRVLTTPACEIVHIPEQVVDKCHALCPSLFPQGRLFGFAPEIVIRKNAKRCKIEVLRETPLYVRRRFSKAMFGCIIR